MRCVGDEGRPGAAGGGSLVSNSLFWFRNAEPSWSTGRWRQKAQYRKGFRSNSRSHFFYVETPSRICFSAGLITLNVCSASNKAGMRRGTRIPCEIPVTLVKPDPTQPLSEQCLVILVNPQGCAARFGRSLEIGAAVRLEGLPANWNVTARVVNCISMGEYEKLWLLGLALDEPGNVWGIESPPEDWMQ